jgi:hypothetical protein
MNFARPVSRILPSELDCTKGDIVAASIQKEERADPEKKQDASKLL